MYPKLLHPACNLEQLLGCFALYYLITVPEGLPVQTACLKDSCKRSGDIFSHETRIRLLEKLLIVLHGRPELPVINGKRKYKYVYTHLSHDVTICAILKFSQTQMALGLILL